MKKHAVFSLILALVLTVGMLSFAACGRQEPPVPSTDSPGTSDASDVAESGSNTSTTEGVTDAATETAAPSKKAPQAS